MKYRGRKGASAGAITGACAVALMAGLFATESSAQLLFGGTRSLAPVVDAVAPAVVNVEILSSKGRRSRLEDDPDFGPLFARPGPGRLSAVSGGSGVIIDATRGYVITNNHVVDDPETEKIVVILRDRRELEATLIGTDPGTDIAVLRVPPQNLVEAPIGDSRRARIGDFVLAVGNPLGLGQSVTSGIVSALGRTIGMNSYEEFIQFDASVHPGNSGGGLFDTEGRLIGINSAVVTASGFGDGRRLGGTGVSWAVPSNIALAVAAQLINHGEVRRGRAGIAAEDVTPAIAGKEKLPVSEGAVVRQVDPESGAARAGLRAGDLITSLGGSPVNSWSQLRNQLSLVPVGESAEVTYVRGQERRRAQLQISPIAVPAGKGGIQLSLLPGATVIDRNDEIAVAGVAEGSVTHRAGLRPGDVIEGVNGRRTTRSADLIKILQDARGEKRISVARGEGKLSLRLPASY